MPSKVFDRWLISITDMPTPGSDTRSRCACSRTGSGSTAGPAEKLKMRGVKVEAIEQAYRAPGSGLRAPLGNWSKAFARRAAVASVASRPLALSPWPLAWKPLDEMRQQPVPELRLEPRGLGGHDLARVRHGHQIGHADRVHREG